MNFRYLLPIETHQSVVALSIFQFPPKQRWWALGQMGRSTLLHPSPKGLLFGKMLGSGKGGFSMMPDFTRYAMLTVWQSIEDANHFFESDATQEYISHTNETYTVLLLPLQAHGYWNRKNPFLETYKLTDPSLPLVVLTRATIHLTRLPEFWRDVPKAQQAIQNSPGLLFSIGVGELPLIQQATISIWENADAIKNFAYQNGLHKQIIQKTRQRNWYSEDLFARFTPLATYGSYQGKDILESYFKK